jgi:aminoglycoside phosphotransferase (APT) family kinase protein
VHPHLPQGIRAIDREYWESYLDDPESWRRRPVMNHGDLFPEHVLVDDEGITGILDWESACFEDPVANVTGLPVADRFADRVARAVFPSTEPDLERRRAFHRHAVPVYSVLYGLEQNDPARVRRSLALYARTLPVSESEPVSPRRGRTREP